MTDDAFPDPAALSGDPVTTRSLTGGASFASGPGLHDVRMGELRRVLGEIQRRGGIGRGSIDAAIEHALAYVAALPSTAGVLVDLGSGGGLPGLVIAVAAPAWELRLVERRAKRADFLRYGVGALGLGERVHVHAEDVERYARRAPSTADVVTARSFAPPLVVLRTACPLLRTPGLVLVSDPPDGLPRWTTEDLDALGLRDLGAVGGIRRIVR